MTDAWSDGRSCILAARSTQLQSTDWTSEGTPHDEVDPETPPSPEVSHAAIPPGKGFGFGVSGPEFFLSAPLSAPVPFASFEKDLVQFGKTSDIGNGNGALPGRTPLHFRQALSRALLPVWFRKVPEHRCVEFIVNQGPGNPFQPFERFPVPLQKALHRFMPVGPGKGNSAVSKSENKQMVLSTPSIRATAVPQST